MYAIAEASEPPSERPPLKIAPRTATTAPTSAKSSIFGGARTREEILASKGIDARKKDAELETKARPKRLTKQQAEELEAAKAEITFEQERLATATTAGDKAAAQAKVDAKEKEVAALGEKFKAQNLAYEHKKTAEKAVRDGLRRDVRAVGEMVVGLQRDVPDEVGDMNERLRDLADNFTVLVHREELLGNAVADERPSRGAHCRVFGAGHFGQAHDDRFQRRRRAERRQDQEDVHDACAGGARSSREGRGLA